MADLFLLKPKTEITAVENLNVFIEKCKYKLTVFGSDLDWESNVWPKLAVFAKLGVTTRKPSQVEMMSSDFVEFAKAYFRYQQGHKPTGTKNELKALRALECALLKINGNASILGLSIDCLDEAADLAKLHYSAGAAYQCGREIERLAKFMSDHHLIPTNLKTWKNPLSRANDRTQTGSDAKAARSKKLPNEIALNALAELFANDPSDDRDIFTTTIFAMLMSAPSRVSEVLALPADCEVIEKDNKGVERYGWRFFSGKHFEGDIKWIPSVMVKIAKIAVKRAKILSLEARQLAKWIEDNPKEFYRHKDCPNVAEATRLTMMQACQALGLSHESIKSCRTSLNNRGLEASDGVHTLASLWDHVRGRLPEDFPWFDKNKGVKYSNALFALNKNQMHANKACLPVELHKPTNNFFNNDIVTRESLGDLHQNIFDRYGYKSESGQRLKVTSHQARHLLNTIAQRGGLSNLDIAKWSGRADINQNRTYNHMTEYEMVALAERIDTSKALFGPTGKVIGNAPVTVQEFNTLEQAAVHVTEYGYCVHDYTMSPCEKFRDCVNCTEQVCVKGDAEKLRRIKERLVNSELLVSTAEKDAIDKGAGVDRWLEYQLKTTKRLRELVGIMEDPSIADGAQVKLKGNDFTQLGRVVAKKLKHALDGNKNDEDKQILEDLSNMLGGGFGKTP